MYYIVLRFRDNCNTGRPLGYGSQCVK